MRQKLLIINKAQFGYHTDTYKYCEYLKEICDITYFCFDEGLARITLKDVECIYISEEESFFLNGCIFYETLLRTFKVRRFDVTMVLDLPFAFAIPLIVSSDKFVLDIRTAAVSKKKLKRIVLNISTKFNTIFFKHITVISDGVAEFFRLNTFKILPLGSDVISDINKSFSDLRLLYVGTLDNRHIDQTIDGIHAFIQKQQIPPMISYDIIGFGSDAERELIKLKILQYSLSDYITFHGRVSHDQLKPFFDKSNIGVSYIPMTKYYFHQPPTKTFEYILSGMACVATGTAENVKIITNQNGVICQDNERSFTEALEFMHANLKLFDSNHIRTHATEHTWKRIIQSILWPYLSEK